MAGGVGMLDDPALIITIGERLWREDSGYAGKD